jgi:acyl carrier protein phosphodiesterase
MNYLAHIYLADITQTSLIGNFLGDFVKGRLEQSNLPEEYEVGVRLHRKIDVFTDAHPIVSRSRTRISTLRRRYAGIVIDMAYDHFLALNWSRYYHQPLSHFVQKFYIELENNAERLPESSKQIMQYLIQGNWLENYQTIAGISFGLNGISQRMLRRFNRENTILDSSQEITANFNDLQNDFFEFFPELIEYTKQLTN